MAEAREHALDGRYPVLDMLHRAWRGELSVEDVLALPLKEQSDLLALIRYEAFYRASKRAWRKPENRRAMALLRSFLTAEQRHMLWKTASFHVRGSSGGMYRIIVRTGAVQRLERHGSRWYWLATFCLHDSGGDDPDGRRLPLADLALQQMLLLCADEPAFLATANVSASRRRMWDPEWLRQLRRATEERERIARAAAMPVARIRIDLSQLSDATDRPAPTEDQRAVA